MDDAWLLQAAQLVEQRMGIQQQQQQQQPVFSPEKVAPPPSGSDEAAWLEAALQAAHQAEERSSPQLVMQKNPARNKQGEAPPKRSRVSVPPTRIHMELVSSSHFRCVGKLHDNITQMLRGLSGCFWDAQSVTWCLPLTSYNTCVYRLRNLFRGVEVAELPAKIKALFVPPGRLSYPAVESVSLDNLSSEVLSALHPFQRESIQFCASRGGRVLIADEMGTGKTVQAIGIASYYRTEWPLLVICPASLMNSWATHLRDWAHAESYQIKSAKTADFDRAPCTIVSYSMAANLGAELRKKNFAVMIVDESHLLKNYSSKRCKVLAPVCKRARRLVMLSGTPALNAPRELFSQLQCIDKMLFSDFSEFAQRYCDPKRTRFGSGWDYSGASNGLELHVLLTSTVMMRRLKAQVLPQLLAKQREQVWLTLDPAMLAGMRDTVLGIRAARDRMRDLQDTRSVEYKEADRLGYSLYMTLYRLTGTAKVPHTQRYVSELLQSEPATKVLLFGHHKAVLDKLCESLSNADVRHVRIDGETPRDSRSLLVREFQDNAECRVAVLSIKAAGVGLTLTAATVVVFAELSFNPGELQQAEDRAHRVGQKRQVRIKYLVARNTIEERIWSRLDSKLRAIGNALNGQAGNMKMEAAETAKLQVDDEFLESFLEANLPAAETEAEALPEEESSEDLEQIQENIRLAKLHQAEKRKSKFAAFARK